MGAHGADGATIHDDDPVGILDGGDPLGDDEFSGARNHPLKGIPDFGIRCGIHRRGGVVQNQNFGILQKSPGNT